jgi:1-deoxy-D-xylulose 5-phosphate reductoisomerase
MSIPIANAIYENKIDLNSKTTTTDFLKNFNVLKFEKVDKKRFPIVTLLGKKIHKNSGSIILNASNEILVESFIKNKISFNAIYQCLKQLFKDRDFSKYVIKKTPNIKEIYKIDKWARKKTIEIISKNYEKKFL